MRTANNGQTTCHRNAEAIVTQTTNPADGIGSAAGKVWHFLNGHGEAMASDLSRSLSMTRSKVHEALGWLAREDKLAITATRRGEVFRLK